MLTTSSEIRFGYLLTTLR